MTDNTGPDLSNMDAHQVIAELGLNPTVELTDVLIICALVGKFLQQVRKDDRARISGRMKLMSESSQLTPEQRHMVLTIIGSWNTFDSSFWTA